MKIEVTSRGGESTIVGKYAAQRIRSAIESASSYGTEYVPAEIVDCTDSLRAVTTDYATVTEDDGTVLWSGWLDGRDEPSPDADAGKPGEGDGNLVTHARRELELIGEEPDFIDWYCRVVREFASYGHSGGSASVAVPVLNKLLRYEPLSAITSDPAEWIDQSEPSGYPFWQNARNSKAFSEDGGKTYWLLDEREAAGSAETTPLHRAAAKAGADQ